MADPAPATVLYIEDDPSSRHLLEVLFERRPDLRLLTASEGRQGLDLARAHRPDLILLDLHLQDMDGEAVLRALRLTPELRHTPVVVFTAEQYSRLPEHLRLAGAQAYVMKPIDIDQFFAVLEAALSESP
jgi:CheY-like chemotaxis protein